jgi:hypothetical protein
MSTVGESSTAGGRWARRPEMDVADSVDDDNASEREAKSEEIIDIPTDTNFADNCNETGKLLAIRKLFTRNENCN